MSIRRRVMGIVMILVGLLTFLHYNLYEEYVAKQINNPMLPIVIGAFMMAGGSLIFVEPKSKAFFILSSPFVFAILVKISAVTIAQTLFGWTDIIFAIGFLLFAWLEQVPEGFVDKLMLVFGNKKTK